MVVKFMCDCEAYARCIADAKMLSAKDRAATKAFCLKYYGYDCDSKCPGEFDDTDDIDDELDTINEIS